MYKILIVEDDHHLRRMYSRIFRLHGYETHAVSDGHQALLTASEKQPHAILLDVMIPTFDGFTVLAKLKKNPATQNCVVIMLTNLSDPQEQEKSYEQGAALYLVKNDHDPKNVIPLVHTVLQKYYTE